jgi:hypothetical protein
VNSYTRLPSGYGLEDGELDWRCPVDGNGGGECGSGTAADAKLQVKTKQGKVEGRVDGDVKAFLGIPFSAPPVGPLRWKPPMPAEKRRGVRLATGFGYLTTKSPKKARKKGVQKE